MEWSDSLRRTRELLREMAGNSTDRWEADNAADAQTWLDLTLAAKSLASLDALYWHLFYYKGVFDSNDQRESMRELRGQAEAAMRAFKEGVEAGGGWS